MKQFNRWSIFLFISAIPLTAQDGGTPLARLRAELDQLRAEAPQHEETRGATPRLTTIKHELRDWVESQLSQVSSDANGTDGAESVLAERLNTELKHEQLLRESDNPLDVDWHSAIGYLSPVRREYRQRQDYLILHTAVEIFCGFDESAYLYRWQNGNWKRLWESEQNIYSKDKYVPQFIRAVQVSPPLTEGSAFVLTLGTQPWCSSNWHDVYVRIWKVSLSGQEPKLLIDKSEWAFLGAHDVPIQGSVGREDALIEYTGLSIDAGDLTREVVLHYSLTPDKAERIDPVALGPRDFVDEWLTEPWEQSQLRSVPSARTALERAHTHAGLDRFQPTKSFRAPEIWQVGLGSLDGKKAPVYYLVRWRPPYHFTMIGVSQQPSPNCTTADRTADDAERTLFPVQDWRE